MGRRNKLFHWKTKRLWIPIQEFAGILDAETAQAAGTADMVNDASGGEIALLAIGAAADEVAHLLPVPWDLDRTKKVLGRIYFIHNSTGTDAPIWKWVTKFHAKQADIVAMDSGADKTTTFAAHTCVATAGGLELTTWTDLSWDTYITSSDVLVGMMIECDDLGSAGANEIQLLGIEIMYQIDAQEDVTTPSTRNELMAQPT